MIVVICVQGLARFLSLLIFRTEEAVLFHLPAEFDAMIPPLVFLPAVVMIFVKNWNLVGKVFNEMYNCDSSDDAS